MDLLSTLSTKYFEPRDDLDIDHIQDVLSGRINPYKRQVGKTVSLLSIIFSDVCLREEMKLDRGRYLYISDHYRSGEHACNMFMNKFYRGDIPPHFISKRYNVLQFEGGEIHFTSMTEMLRTPMDKLRGMRFDICIDDTRPNIPTIQYNNLSDLLNTKFGPGVFSECNFYSLF